MKYILSLVLTCITVTVFAQTETAMSIADFKTLGNSGRHLEILRSAEKVKAGERDIDWESIVSKAAKGLMDQIAKPADARWAYEIGKSLKEQNPHLKNDKDFMYSVGRAGSFAFSSKAVAAPYFEASLAKDDERCKEVLVKDAISDAFTRSGFAEEKKSALKVAFELCAKHVDEPWIKAMTESETGLKTVCADLLKTGKLTGVRLTKCQKMKE